MSTHTYVVLELSPQAYDEIREQLKAAGCRDVFSMDAPPRIHLHGLSVMRATEELNGRPAHVVTWRISEKQFQVTVDGRELATSSSIGTLLQSLSDAMKLATGSDITFVALENNAKG